MNIRFDAEKRMQKQGKEETRQGLFYALCLLFFWGAVVISGFTYIHSKIMDEMNGQQLQEIELMNDKIYDVFSRIEVHLVYLSNLYTVKRFLEEEEPEFRKEVERLFKRVVEISANPSFPRFDQVRLLDLNGYEKVRVNLNDRNVAEAVPVNQLQNKSNRYYFRESLTLSDHQMYMSPMDLNVENEQIEKPYKPMIRFGMPVFDAHKERIGVLIFNYQAQQIFDSLEAMNVHKGDQWILLNSEGYYLHGPDPEKSFGFMFPEKKTGFFSDHPDLWRKILETDDKIFRQPEAIYFRKGVTPIRKNDTILTVMPRCNWTLLMVMPWENVRGKDGLLIRGTVLLTCIIGPILGLLGWFLGKSRVKNRWYLKSLEESATRDGMTGLFNHREAMHRLEYQIDLSERTGTSLCVAFFDLNDLKPVNDTLGHESGDQMIIAAADSIAGSIRKSDIAARIGGDEFLAIFPNFHFEHTQSVFQRIEQLYADKSRELFNRELTLSWGLSCWEGKSDTVENLIARADKDMYEMKQKYKQRQLTQQ